MLGPKKQDFWQTIIQHILKETIVNKVHKFWEDHKFLQNLHRRFVLCSNGQIYSEDFTKFCGLLRIYEHYQNEILVMQWSYKVFPSLRSL